MALGSLPKKIVDKNGNITADAQNWFNLLWKRTGGAISNVAPYNATYILQKADVADLPNSQALSALSSGFVKVATGTGVLSSTSNTLIQATDLVNAGAFTGDISGTFPAATVIKINGVTLGSTTATAGNVLIGSGTQWVTNAISGDATLGSTGTLTLANTTVTAGTYTVNGANLLTVDAKGRLTAAHNITISSAGSAPTVQKFLSGSGTYTTPANVLYLKVTMIGGGGGGGGSCNNASNNGGTGGSGGNTTFGTSLLVANGGAGGTGTSQSQGGAGGTASLGTGPLGIALSGSQGSNANEGQGILTTYLMLGGDGAQSVLGGKGPGGRDGNFAGSDAQTNTGSGGGGAGAPGGGIAGKGGGAGGYVHAIITSPSATYSYAVGAAGTAGPAGTGGSAGGAGAAGLILVEEYYQ